MNRPHLCVAVCLGILTDDTFAKSPQMPAPRADMPGLPLGTIPGTKLEPGRRRPASGLAEAERRADRTLAARSPLGPAADSRATSAGG